MLPAKASMSKGRGASDGEADEKAEGIRIHTHNTNTSQELCKSAYLLWDLFGVQVRVLHFLLMKRDQNKTQKQTTRKTVNRL